VAPGGVDAGGTRWQGQPRLFVAVWPPAPCVALVEGIARPADSGIRWEPPGLSHVTLRFLGRTDPAVVAGALAQTRLPAAIARVGPAVTMLGPSVVCAPVGGLDDLAAAVVAATKDLGDPPPDRPFAGHITIGRIPDQRRGDGRADVVGQAVACTFDVTEVALVRSHLPSSIEPVRRYETLATFALH